MKIASTDDGDEGANGSCDEQDAHRAEPKVGRQLFKVGSAGAESNVRARVRAEEKTVGRRAELTHLGTT